MEEIQWDKQFEVGSFEIDREHQIFILTINKLIRALDTNARQEVLAGLIDEILKYAAFHFCSEENIMLVSEYPGIQEHKKEHETLLIKLREITPIMNVEDYIDYGRNLVPFLFHWFKTHTIQTDKKLANHLSSRAT